MMWPYYSDGWSWLWMSGMMVVFWGAVLALAVLVIRVLVPRQSGSDDAMATLRKRLAAGEISQEDFEKTRRILQG